MPVGRGFVDQSRWLGLSVVTMNPDLVRNYLTSLQDRLCATLEEVDGKAKFITDEWKRAEGGGGADAGLPVGRDTAADGGAGTG